MKLGRSKNKYRTLRHLHRYREIVGVFLRYGFHEFITPGRVRGISGSEKKAAVKEGEKQAETYTHWERIRMVLEELGPTFIKLGQIMSNRPDLLEPELIRELEKLQTQVPPFPAEDARRIIEAELGTPADELFGHFEPVPIASASIAQVHQANLPGGERVVIKVQRPNIESTINTDIEILIRIAGLFERIVLKSKVLDAVTIIKEFGKSLNREIDFINEQMNIEKFSSNFEGTSSVVVPKVYRDYTAKRVITMEYIDGIHVSDLDALQALHIDTRRIADEGTKLVLEQIFDHGFFHADPHPGNIFALADGRICFLDFGMMGMILPKHRQHLGAIILGIVNQDYERITKALIDFSKTDSVENIDELEYEIFEITESYAHLPLQDIDMGEMLPTMLSVLLKYDIRLPANIFMLTKALITIEGVGRKLDPSYDLVSHIEPYAKQLLRKQFKADRLKKEAAAAAIGIHDLVRTFPEDAKDIIKVAKSGKLKLAFEENSFHQFIRKLGTITNRITLSIVFASLTIGAALVFNTQLPPLWRGIPLFGLAGVGGAAVTGIWLLISILRNKRL